MRKFLLGIALVAITSGGSYAANCVSQGFDAYLTGGYTCTIPTNSGIVTFSNFTLDFNQTTGSGSGATVATSSITVDPFGFFGDTYGLMLSGAFHVDNTQQYLLQFRYIVSSPLPITAGTVAFVNGSTACVGRSCSNVTLTKDIFVPPPAPSAAGTAYATASVDDVTAVSPEITFAPLATFGVRDTLTLAANHNLATATSFGNEFLTPEPATLTLAGLALVGFALFGRRKRS